MRQLLFDILPRIGAVLLVVLVLVMLASQLIAWVDVDETGLPGRPT